MARRAIPQVRRARSWPILALGLACTLAVMQTSRERAFLPQYEWSTLSLHVDKEHNVDVHPASGIVGSRVPWASPLVVVPVASFLAQAILHLSHREQKHEGAFQELNVENTDELDPVGLRLVCSSGALVATALGLRFGWRRHRVARATSRTEADILQLRLFAEKTLMAIKEVDTPQLWTRSTSLPVISTSGSQKLAAEMLSTCERISDRSLGSAGKQSTCTHISDHSPGYVDWSSEDDQEWEDQLGGLASEVSGPLFPLATPPRTKSREMDSPQLWTRSISFPVKGTPEFQKLAAEMQSARKQISEHDPGFEIWSSENDDTWADHMGREFGYVRQMSYQMETHNSSGWQGEVIIDLKPNAWFSKTEVAERIRDPQSGRVLHELNADLQ